MFVRLGLMNNFRRKTLEVSVVHTRLILEPSAHASLPVHNAMHLCQFSIQLSCRARHRLVVRQIRPRHSVCSNRPHQYYAYDAA